MINEKILSITSSQGNRLNGIMNIPLCKNDNYNYTIVIMVHAGVRGRVGPVRQYVYYARTLAKSGYYVFRFDSYGMGDSEGEIEVCNSKNYYRTIQLGRYIQDTIDVIKFLKENYPVNRVILLGLCGGGITSLITSRVEPSVNGLILLGTPVMLDDEQVDYMSRTPKDFYKRGISSYLKKIMDLGAWKRALSGQSDYFILFLLKGYFKKIIESFKQKPNSRVKTGNKNTMSENLKRSQYNELFSKSLQEGRKRGIDTLFIYGDNDYFRVEFESEVLTRFNNKLPGNCTFKMIENANHMLSLPKWQVQAMDIFKPWLDEIADH